MRQDDSGFHLEKSISVGHIITTMTIVVSVVWWASTVETRLAVNATQIEAVRTEATRQSEDAKIYRAEIREQLILINNKLDRIAEIRAKN